MRDPTEEDPREVEASKHDLNYIGLDVTFINLDINFPRETSVAWLTVLVWLWALWILSNCTKELLQTFWTLEEEPTPNKSLKLSKLSALILKYQIFIVND
jgi:hypothetical protein